MSCSVSVCVFFFNDTATTEIFTLSLHDALPISACGSSRCTQGRRRPRRRGRARTRSAPRRLPSPRGRRRGRRARSEEHTSELQSRQYIVCRLLLEKKKKKTYAHDELEETHQPGR